MMYKKVFLIAEIAQAHDGSLGIAHSYIDALAETGVDAIKFQTHIAEAESSEHEPFRVKFSYKDKTRYDYWKRMEFSFQEWLGLKEHCCKKGMEFISSPFSNQAVDLLENIGVARYKVGSGEVNNFLLLQKIALTGKPIILSSGMSSIDEIENALLFLKPFNNHITVLQCTTAYPTEAGQWGLAMLPLLKKRFDLPIGFSDHSGKMHPSIAAVALGAQIIEFHATFDRSMFGPDAKASLTISEIKELVISIREVEIDLNKKANKIPEKGVTELKKIFEKSLAVNKSLEAGHTIMFEDLEAKKPKGYGIDAEKFNSIIGRQLRANKEAFSFLNETDLL